MRDFVARFPLASERGFSPDFTGADSGLPWAGSEWAGTGSWVAAKPWPIDHPDHTSPSITTEPTRRTHMLVLLLMFRVACALRSGLAGYPKRGRQI